MLSRIDKFFFEDLIEQQNQSPIYYQQTFGACESNILNFETLTKQNKDQKAVQKWLEFYGTDKDKLSDVETAREWQQYYINGNKHVVLEAGHYFDQNEEIKVLLEQLNTMDLKNNITYRKSAYHSHNFFEIIYVYKGSCTTTISGVPAMLMEGDICIYNLQAVHQIGLFDIDTVVFNVLIRQSLFTDVFLRLIQQNSCITSFFINSIFNIDNPGQHMVFHRNDQSDCELYICKIIEEYYKNPIQNQGMMKSLLIPFFTSLFYSYKDMLTKDSAYYYNDKRIDITQIISYIGQQYQTITLEKLAAHFKYSPRSMIRIIQKYTHRKFKDIVRQIRLKNACDLLVNTELSISDITLKVGYSDRSYLDRLLKAQYNLSAYEYRNHYQNK